jgi:AraC family transcriptional regulator of arabinose operon
MIQYESPTVKFNLLASEHYVRDANYHEIREKGTGDWLLLHTLNGNGILETEHEDSLAVLPGWTGLFRPRTRQDYRCDAATNHWEFIWSHFRPPPAWEEELLSWPQPARGIFLLPRPAPVVLRRVVRALRTMLVLERGPWQQAERLAMNALEEAMLWLASSKHTPDHPAIDPQVLAAQEYLCLNLSKKITLAALAEATAQSVSRLSHSFMEQTGLTPMEFLEQRRLARAAHLLRSTRMPIKELSAEVGFASPFYFSLRFKKHTGANPRAWRKQQQLSGDDSSLS